MWVKFISEQDIYVVDLGCISGFALAQNGKLLLWLPDGKVPIVIHPQTNPDAYRQILDYLENTTGKSLLP